MINVWPEGCWWPKSVGDWYEGGWMDGVNVVLGNRGMTVEAILTLPYHLSLNIPPEIHPALKPC